MTNLLTSLFHSLRDVFDLMIEYLDVKSLTSLSQANHGFSQYEKPWESRWKELYNKSIPYDREKRKIIREIDSDFSHSSSVIGFLIEKYDSGETLLENDRYTFILILGAKWGLFKKFQRDLKKKEFTIRTGYKPVLKFSFLIAAIYGRIRILDILEKKFSFKYDERLIKETISKPLPLNSTKWLIRTSEEPTQMIFDLLQIQMKVGKFQCISYLLKKVEFDKSHSLIESIRENNEDEYLKLIFQAIKNGKDDLIEFFVFINSQSLEINLYLIDALLLATEILPMKYFEKFTRRYRRANYQDRGFLKRAFETNLAYVEYLLARGVNIDSFMKNDLPFPPN